VTGEVLVGGLRGALIVIKQPADRLVAVVIRILARCQGMRVLTDQIVQAVAAAVHLHEQVVVVQVRQPAARAERVGVAESSGRVGVDVGARVQPEAPEQPLLTFRKVPVRQVECGGNRQVLGGHQLQPAPCRGQIGD
jgi:hypothetical protein